MKAQLRRTEKDSVKKRKGQRKGQREHKLDKIMIKNPENFQPLNWKK